MTPHSAVLTDTALARGSLDLKHAALLYDQIIVLRTEEARFDANQKAKSVKRMLGRDHDFLLDRGVVSVVDDQADPYLVSENPTYAAHRHEVKVGICNWLLLRADQAEPYVRRAASGASRSFSLAYELKHQAPCTPIVFGAHLKLDSSEATAPPEPQEARMAAAFALTLRALPMPSAQTSWQQILEFRADPESREAFLDLRLWLNDSLRQGLGPIDLQLRLESQLQRYERALKQHRIRCSLRRLQAIVTAPLSFAEKVVKLQWSDAAKSLFEVATQELDFMKEEGQLANRDLRYLVLARDALEKA